MGLKIKPDEYSLVHFDPAVVQSAASKAYADAGLESVPVSVEIDESVSFSRAIIGDVEPYVLDIDGGAIEDPKKLSHVAEWRALDTFGRLMLMISDIELKPFGFEGEIAEMSMRQLTAWETYSVGRLVRKGYRNQKGRRRYVFRVAHSFTDVADRCFEELWNGDNLTFSDVRRLSEESLVSA